VFFIVHPGIDDFFAGKAIEKAVTLVELRPEPVAIVGAKRLALAELGSVRVARKDLVYVAVDSGKELRGRLLREATVMPQAVAQLSRPIRTIFFDYRVLRLATLVEGSSSRL
jgi:hypothetical protein